MADKQVSLPAGSLVNEDFTLGLIPSATRVELLYHLSYLCLGGIAELETKLRKQAVDTQMLFGSSQEVLAQCVGTSENLVNLLLPNLILAAEKNDSELAGQFLKQAEDWIDDIINSVSEIVTGYTKHNNNVAQSTSEINTKKEQVDKDKKKLTAEMENFKKIGESLEANLAKISKDLADNDKKIDQKNAEIQSYIDKITKEASEGAATTGITDAAAAGVAIAGAATGGTAIIVASLLLPFAKITMDMVSQIVTSGNQKEIIKTLQKGLSDLMDVQKRLREQEWDIQNKLMDNQLQLAKLLIDDGQTPDTTYLDEVQQCLSRIQNILVQLQLMWQNIRAKLRTLKQTDDSGKNWISKLGEGKPQFLHSIDVASEGWKQFGGCCSRAIAIFSVQGNDAYTFLEVNPASLSKDAWKKEYEAVKQKLEKIKPNPPSKAPALLNQ